MLTKPEAGIIQGYQSMPICACVVVMPLVLIGPDLPGNIQDIQGRRLCPCISDKTFAVHCSCRKEQWQFGVGKEWCVLRFVGAFCC